jgi:quercetin dioxygenase-like cupin family protein
MSETSAFRRTEAVRPSIISAGTHGGRMKILLLFLCLCSAPLMAQSSKLRPLLSKDLTAAPNKETTMVTVEYAPGASDPIHRHNAQVFVYVLEGSVVMQVRGGKQQTLGAGRTFYEATNDVHVIGRNASQTKPAKVLVFLVKDKGAPLLIPAK